MPLLMGVAGFAENLLSSYTYGKLAEVVLDTLLISQGIIMIFNLKGVISPVNLNRGRLSAVFQESLGTKGLFSSFR